MCHHGRCCWEMCPHCMGFNIQTKSVERLPSPPSATYLRVSPKDEEREVLEDTVDGLTPERGCL
jgi:hypothetical protein